MKNYFFTLLGVMLLSSLISVLCMEDGTKRYVKLVCSLCALCALILPLGEEILLGEWDLSFLEEHGDGSVNYEEIYGDALQKNEIKYAEEILKKEVCETFSLASDQLEVHLSVVSKNGNNTVSEIRVVLKEKAALSNPHPLILWLNDRVGCPAAVVYG